MTPRYQSIIFDLDGTLVDSYEALHEAVNFVLSSHDAPLISPSQLRAFVGEGVTRLLERAFGSTEVPEGAAALFEERYGAVCCEQSRLLDDVKDMLAELATIPVEMGVCTNKPTSFSVKILQSLGIADYFGIIAGPDLAGARKPDAAHVDHVRAALGNRDAPALMVGDMPIDVAAARNALIDVAVIPTGSSSMDELRAARADYYMESLRELAGLVRGNGKAS